MLCFLSSKNKVNNVLIELLGTIPQNKLKYEFTTFLERLVCIKQIFLIIL